MLSAATWAMDAGAMLGDSMCGGSLFGSLAGPSAFTSNFGSPAGAPFGAILASPEGAAEVCSSSLR
jgi:hypothetical protein